MKFLRDFYRQLFLTDGALHLLVVDLSKFDRDPLERGDAVYIWLDSLLCRVPESVVLVVGTHVDAFRDDHERSAAALENLKAAITEHLETKRKVCNLIYIADCRSGHEQSYCIVLSLALRRTDAILFEGSSERMDN